MKRRSPDDSRVREITNPRGGDNREDQEGRPDGDPRSLTGKYLPRLVVSAAALTLIIVKAARPGTHIDAVTLGLLALAAIPWLSEVIQSATMGGFSIEFKRLERRQDRQGLLQEEQRKEIRQLRFLVSNFASPAEFTHLTKLVGGEPFPVFSDDGTYGFFRGELHRLRELRLIEGQPGKGLRSMDSEGGDVKDHFKITDKGKELLSWLAEVSTDDENEAGLNGPG
jgi:hypothetical protein